MKPEAQNISLIYLFSLLMLVYAKTECNKQYGGEDSFACLCNETSCDDFPSFSWPDAGYYLAITSSRDELRFRSETASLASGISEKDASIFINSSQVFQTMIGFGSSFTDAAGIDVATLSKPLQETFVRQYFSPDGIEYNIGRIPIAGCDFSIRPYSYDDVEGDIELKYFNLTEEDYFYKIPLMKRAMQVGRRPLRLYGSPWSPPSWMKTNGMFNGSGELLPEMQQPWANYFVKFLDAYKREGVSLWGLTAQNEPSLGKTDFWWNSCYFTAEQQRDFVKYYLGPTLHTSGYAFIKLMIGDDSRYIFPDFAEKVLSDAECAKYVDGIGVHWYTDDFTPISILDELHTEFPDKFILYSEASNGAFPFTSSKNSIPLGIWERGENYALDIIENVNHWAAGWTDWNIALDTNGGPSWVSNQLDSPIIINTVSNEFYKQPTFYVMGHFSKFVPEGSKRIFSSVKVEDNEKTKFGKRKKSEIDAVSFINPDGYTVIVILNRYDKEVSVGIKDRSGNEFQRLLPAKSIETILYKEIQ